jgi:transposase
MSNLKYSIGVDVSKSDFHCCLSVIDTEQSIKIKSSHKFTNSNLGFKSFVDWLNRNRKEHLPITIVMEATGVYHEQLAWYLNNKDLPVSILLPNKAKKYLQADGNKSKNDTIDSRGLSRIGAEKKLELWTPPSKMLYELRCYTRQHQNLTEMCTGLNSQLEAITHSQFQNKEVIKQLSKTMRLLEKQLSEMESIIGGLIKSDAVLNMHYQNISAIKGIGMLSFAVIAAETNGFTLFKSAAALVSYSGYDVIENQSGKHTGKTKISKKGNSRLRRILHMPAFCAVRDDQPVFKNLYQRVYERTGIKMKGYVAVQKKILIMAYYLWKKNEKFDATFDNLEKIASEQAEATHDKIPNGIFH